MARSEIIVKNCQIKSFKSFRDIARGLNTIEEASGIKETKITLDNMFICPWIDFNNRKLTEMEIVLKTIIDRIN